MQVLIQTLATFTRLLHCSASICNKQSLLAFIPNLQEHQGLHEFEAPSVEPLRGRTGQRINVHHPGQDAGHLNQAVFAGDAPVCNQSVLLHFSEHDL